MPPIFFMMAARKVIPPILLCWPTTSEADGGGMAIAAEPSHQHPVHFVTVQQMAAEGQLDKMASGSFIVEKLPVLISTTEKQSSWNP